MTLAWITLACPTLALGDEALRRGRPFPQAPGPATPKVKASVFSSTGQVVAVLPRQAQLIVRCNPLKAVGWRSLTRKFPVADRNLLKSLKKGDQIEFDVRFEGQKYTIVDIDKR
jgi:Cu/Ag efflux protein CusF